MRTELDPHVTKYPLLRMQVCVPEDWTDEQIVEFASRECPMVTEGNKWAIRREGSPLLGVDQEREPCLGRTGYIHVTLDV